MRSSLNCGQSLQCRSRFPFDTAHLEKHVKSSYCKHDTNPDLGINACSERAMPDFSMTAGQKRGSLVFQKLFNNWTDFLPHPGLNGARSPLVRSSAARCTILRSDCRFSDNEHRCEGLALAPKTPKDAASPRHLYFGKTFEGELHGCGTTSSALRSGRSRSCRFVEDSLKERKR